jgi:phage baseplate assembly protein W
MENTWDEYLGSGIAFPLQIEDGRAKILTGVSLIKLSILNIIVWPYGRRYFMGQYGSKIDSLLEKPADIVTLNLVRDFIIESINTFEKRIKLIEVRLYIEDETMKAFLKYLIVQDNTVDSFIVPFYSQIRY